jgi:hypothetical protein
MAILTEPEPVRVWPLLMERLTTDLPVDLAVLIDLDWDVGTGHALTGKPDWLHEAPLDALINAHMRVHPLLRHYARTADRTPLALDEIADDRWWKSEAYRAGKSAIGIDRQLALPLSSRPRQVRGVIMSRSGHGFTDRDLEYAGLARSLLDTVSAHESVTLRIPRFGDPAEYGLMPSAPDSGSQRRPSSSTRRTSTRSSACTTESRQSTRPARSASSLNRPPADTSR